MAGTKRTTTEPVPDTRASTRVKTALSKQREISESASSLVQALHGISRDKRRAGGNRCFEGARAIEATAHSTEAKEPKTS